MRQWREDTGVASVIIYRDLLEFGWGVQGMQGGGSGFNLAQNMAQMGKIIRGRFCI